MQSRCRVLFPSFNPSTHLYTWGKWGTVKVSCHWTVQSNEPSRTSTQTLHMLNTSVHMLTSYLLSSTIFADFQVQFNWSNDSLYSSKSQEHASGITGGICNLHWKFKNMESVYFIWIKLWCSQVSFMLRVSNCPHCNDDMGHFPKACPGFNNRKHFRLLPSTTTEKNW